MSAATSHPQSRPDRATSPDLAAAALLAVAGPALLAASASLSRSAPTTPEDAVLRLLALLAGREVVDRAVVGQLALGHAPLLRAGDDACRAGTGRGAGDAGTHGALLGLGGARLGARGRGCCCLGAPSISGPCLSRTSLLGPCLGGAGLGVLDGLRLAAQGLGVAATVLAGLGAQVALLSGGLGRAGLILPERSRLVAAAGGRSSSGTGAGPRADTRCGGPGAGAALRGIAQRALRGGIG